MSHRRPYTFSDKLEEHPAFIAWTRVDSKACPPKEIEVLQPEKHNKGVFRLKGVGGAPPTFIAKRRRDGELDLEVQIFRELLPSLSLPSLEVYAYQRGHNDYSWMFIEDAEENWYSPNSAEHGSAAARWMAGLHVGCSAGAVMLPETGAKYFVGVLEAARNGVVQSLDHSALSPSDISLLNLVLRHLDKIERCWSDIVGATTGVRETVTHGDFLPKNVRVRSRRGKKELLVLDWEKAGIATPAVDVALLPADETLLHLYHQTVQEAWPELRWTEVLKLQEAGKLFRVLHNIYWQTFDFHHAWVERAMSHMIIYEAQLRDVLRRAHGRAP